MGGFRGLPIAILLLVLTGAANAMEILVLRHAEKQSGTGPDPGLSPAGENRAAAIAGRFRPDVVYATPWRRAIETARPAAEAAGVVVRLYDPARPEQLVGKIRALPPDAQVLVVGHSNTVPDLVRRLSGTAAEAMPESEYDRWTLVRIGTDGNTAVDVRRY
ncbi:SixA phosphatase family protein [Arenimonas fontis]|uniref:Histidine phosphatase family protein n=1 Tax=Arenimonas fontis TaxID=2608255 RepID=A0A5B2ZDB0_9GAMM|nr:phosphoglycerate mutase family protein [Arenimonas fontis]KAA2285603.1 histidine phosphatase family protein [Arenimonas fontis]